MTTQLTAVIISVSSDIGLALAKRWRTRGWRVIGTYRTDSPALSENRVEEVSCDLTDAVSVMRACGELNRLAGRWDILVLCPATLEPVGPFVDSSFDAWDASLHVNFTNQMRIVHEMLPHRNRDAEQGPIVLFFAGGGTNNAVVNYSAYTLSKIALIKMCELLDAEIPDTRFTILGPGWVKTKIHHSTLKAGEKAGGNYARTKAMFAGGTWTPMERVLDCCDWVVGSKREVVGGRNFSVVHDRWGRSSLEEMLVSNRELYKLRRNGNTLLVNKTGVPNESQTFRNS